MITTKDIIIDPHDTLRARAEEVKAPISEEDKVTLRGLLEYVIDENPENTVSYALYNPKIISNSVAKCYLAGGEGCLSVDKEIQGYVPRYSKIKVVGYNENDEKITLTLTDLPSICFQHEIDHLNGIMFYDHINKENPFDVPAEYEKL